MYSSLSMLFKVNIHDLIFRIFSVSADNSCFEFKKRPYAKLILVIGNTQNSCLGSIPNF